MLVHRLRLLGGRCLREARPVALARVGDERELADDERLAADVDERAVEAPVLVLEDPKARDLGGHALCVGGRVAGCDPEQNDDAGPTRGRPLASHRDRRLGDALDDRPHAYSSSSPSVVRGRNERASLMCGVASSRRP